MGRTKGSKNKRKVKERVMVDSYIINNGGEGEEIPITKRDNPMDTILEASKAPKTAEKVPDQPQSPLAVGDALTKEYKDSFAGKEESIVVENPKEIVYGHCNNCRLELTEERVIKNAIDWTRTEDGTLNKYASRFSVFCKNCMKFICIIDKVAQKMLDEMIKRNVR